MLPVKRGLADLSADERRRIEQERLARISARNILLSTSEPTHNVHSCALSPNSTPHNKPTTSHPSAVSEYHVGKYPDGAIFLTHVLGCEKDDFRITFEEVLQLRELVQAVFSSYIIDFCWLHEKLDLNPDCKVAICLHGAPENEDFFGFHLFPTPRPKLLMHSKLQLLFYEKWLRIVFPSANLVAYDWGETGVMENILFFQDFPRLERPLDQSSNPFVRELTLFIIQAKYPPEIIDSFRDFDFRQAHVRVIHSIGGSHHPFKTGIECLEEALEDTGLSCQATTFKAFTSSIGSLRPEFIYNFQKEIVTPFIADIINTTQVYYFSQKTVKASRGGTDSAGTLFLDVGHITIHHFRNKFFTRDIRPYQEFCSTTRLCLQRMMQAKRFGYT